MADTAKKTKATTKVAAQATAKATATPRQASAKNVKVAEVAKPTTSVRKGIELVPKVEELKKAKVAPATPKTTAKKESVVSNSQPKVLSREKIEKVAYQIWVQLGYRHGYALEDWLMAERALLERAS
jgi:Protein of unknown function (DUF2934)